MEKYQTVAGRNWESVPKSVYHHFNLHKKKTDYDTKKITMSVSYSGMLFVIYLTRCSVLHNITST